MSDREDGVEGAEQTGLGGRLALLEPGALSSEQRALKEQMEATVLPWAERSGFRGTGRGGTVIGPFNALLVNPALGAAQMAYLDAERASTSLTTRVREVVILTVGAVWQSAYELYAHRAVAAAVGLDAGDVERIASGEAPETLAAEEFVAWRFVTAITAKHRVGEALYAEAVGAFGEKGLVDMVHLAGMYMTVSALLNAFEVPVPG